MERKVKIYLTEKEILKNKLFDGGEIRVTVKVIKAKKLHYYLIPKNPPQPIDQNHINSCRVLYNNNKGKSDSKSTDDFVSEVYPHKNVKWIGKSTDKNYKIAID